MPASQPHEELYRDPEEYFAALGLEKLPKLLTTEQAAEITGLSRQTIHHLVQTGDLAGILVTRRRLRIFRESLRDYLRRRLTT